MRLSLRHKAEQTWDVTQYIWLENVSPDHIMLHLPSGELRLDKGRRLRFRSDILDQPQVIELLDAGKLAGAPPAGRR